MMLKTNNSKLIQCAIVGDGLVGKTALVKTFAQNIKCSENYVATIFDNFAGDISVMGDKYTVSVYDTAGQQDYEGLRVFTYAHSDVIIVCYSAVDRESFNNVSEFWIHEIKTYVHKTTPIILVATQKDMVSNSNEVVKRCEGLDLAAKIKASVFVESSTHDDKSVKELFENVVVKAVSKRKRKTSLVERILRR